MHTEIAADAVAGAVLEIDAGGPEILPRQGVELRAGGAVGEDCARDRDMAAQHAGEAVASRRCAVCVPLISVAFFTAFSNAIGSLPRTGLPPPPAINRLRASAAVALSRAIAAPLLANAISVGVSASGSRTSADCSRW